MRADNSSTDPFLTASIAANTRWAHEPDRAAATRPAREAFEERFLTEVDPDGKLAPAERARRAANAKKAYFHRLALRSAQSRRRAKELPGRDALDALGGGLDGAA